MVVKIMIMLIGTLFYLLSGPVIKRILTSMSAIEMKTSDNIGLLIGYIERMLVILFLYSVNIQQSDLSLQVNRYYDSMILRMMVKIIILIKSIKKVNIFYWERC